MHRKRLFSLFLALSLVLSLVLTACDDTETTQTDGETTASATEPAAAPKPTARPTARPAATSAPEVAPAGGSADWLVMMYLDADDETLEKDIFTDLNEAERVGSTDKLSIVAQIDRYKGGFKGDGGWSTTKRFYLTQDANLKKIASPEIADLGEVNMADGQTLVDFVTWAVANYPAKHYALIMSDHGMGWPGGYFDPAPGGNGPDDVALAQDYGDGMWLMELDKALTQISKETGIQKLDLIGFDACLMGHLEVYTAMAAHAKYMVASQEVEPGLGWAYADFLIKLAFDTKMDGAQLSKDIVEAYIDKDQLITDDKARQEYAQENLQNTSPTAKQAAKELGQDVTLAAVDLSKNANLLKSLDQLAYAMGGADQNWIAKTRAHAQAFENVFDENLPSPYIDLANFAGILIDNNKDEKVSQAAQGVIDAIQAMVLSEKHGKSRAGANGVSIYFPVYDMYNVSDDLGYTTIAAPFTKKSQWDEFLDYHFSNQPPSGGEWGSVDLWKADSHASGKRAGAKKVTIEPLSLSGDTTSAGSPVTINTTIQGQVAYVYYFLGKLSEDGNRLSVEDMDYIDAGQTKLVDGVYMPDWEDNNGELPIDIETDFDPIVYAINDGSTPLTQALFMPEEYGQESSTYTLEGIYQFSDGSPERYAKLFFVDGEMQKVIGYMSPDGAGAPRQITPQPGDQFVILNQGYNLQENSSEEMYSERGTVLTFGTENFTWKEQPASAGTYVVGIIAEDFDGNQYAEFEVVEVK